MFVGGDELAYLARIADDHLGSAVPDAVVELRLGESMRHVGE